MSVTRQSLRFQCSVKDCPWPQDEEIHVPWCLGIPDVEHWRDKPTHQHHPKKGMGGNNPKSRIVAILCPPCHDRVDNGTDWGNSVDMAFRDGKPIGMYRVFDLHNNTLMERPVLSDGAEAVARTPASSPDPSAPSPSAGEKEEGDETALDGLRDVAGPGDVDVGSNPKSLPILTHEQRVAIAQEIKDAEWNRQFLAGDTGNAWIAELGEEAEQYLSDFGYVHESLANILRVCAAIPPPYRNGNLRFSHHTVVYELPPEERMRWLTECEENEWSVAEFRRQVKGTKPRVKRWSLEELREALSEFEHEPPQSGEAAMVSAESIVFFLDWIESHAA